MPPNSANTLNDLFKSVYQPSAQDLAALRNYPSVNISEPTKKQIRDHQAEMLFKFLSLPVHERETFLNYCLAKKHYETFITNAGTSYFSSIPDLTPKDYEKAHLDAVADQALLDATWEDLKNSK